LHEGQLAEAHAAFHRSHELGNRDPNWGYPSAEFVKRCERLLSLEKQLPAVLAGKDKPADASARLDYAELCRSKRLFAAASRLSEEAFAAQPALAESGQPAHRYMAACSAAMAGCGKGKDAGELDDAARARWRKQALTWLEADLALRTREVETGTPQAGQRVAKTLRRWQWDPELTGLRDKDSLARFPEAEQQACRKFWQEVEKLLNASIHRRP
jgi:hypothetical protein